ncbi:MAG: cysteine--tRNA ligase [Candidatus Woesearchaeota archaeon]
MPVSLYNTLTRQKEELKPIENNTVKIYSCGPTVYNFAHIGNFRAFISSDILKRYLKYKGFKVMHVMNITDVDDKTIRDSKKEGLSLKDFTQKYTLYFLEDFKTLSIQLPDVMPKATEHINEMVSLIKELLAKGVAYKAEDGVYYKISKFPSYGRLSRINPEKTLAGASKRVLKDEYDKESVEDFALWKFWDESDGDVFWDTTFGRGRPGWHIECSAMSMKYLGEHFDIHTGGVDLIFPHHENEIAQSEAATQKKFVNFWFHNEYILVEGKKMSKSLGNFYTLRDILAKGFSPMAIRYLLLSAHYRQPLNFTFEALRSSQKAIERLYELYDKLLSYNGGSFNADFDGFLHKVKNDFESAMDDDLNISTALAVLFDFVKETNKMISESGIDTKNAKDALQLLLSIDYVLGILSMEKSDVPQEIINLAELREQARKAKDWKKADNLRSEILNLGYSVDDTPSGPKIKKL